MLNIINEEKVELYSRESKGLKVVAAVTKGDQIITPADGDKEAVTKAVADYSIVGTFNGEEVLSEQGAGYRQTVNRGRKAFKELWEKHVSPIVEKEKAEAAKAAAEAKELREKEKAEKEAEKKAAAEKKEAEKAAKAAEKKAEAEKKAQEKAAKEAEKKAAAEAAK